jgi:hypothetical protein
MTVMLAVIQSSSTLVGNCRNKSSSALLRWLNACFSSKPTAAKVFP